MKHKYVDIPAIVQVIGNIYNNPSILDNEDYHFCEEDFPEEFHKILFGSIYNLYAKGTSQINISTIEDYLEKRPKAFAVYNDQKGREYLETISTEVSQASFKYYYDRMKKMTLMRAYSELCGIDLTWLYDPDDILNPKKKQTQEDWLDNSTLDEIAEIIDKRIESIKLQYATTTGEEVISASDGLDLLLNELSTTPDMGLPFYGGIFNTVTRGARLRKFYLNSAASGIGKSRWLVSQATYIACDEYYDITQKKWIDSGFSEPCVYITTELEKSEVQTMMLAFLADVDEEHILSHHYDFGEEDRVHYAARLLSKSPLYIVELPDFSLQDIETTIKRSINNYDISYVFYDYIHSSIKILSEIGSKAGIKGLREDNILFMLSTKLKDICNKYGVFIASATQLNGGYLEAEVYDQNLLRGAKSIADKLDFGSIMITASQEDLSALTPIIRAKNCPKPNMKIAVYKNRRGRYKDILLWCNARRDVCRFDVLFATTYQYELIDIPDYNYSFEEDYSDRY